MATISISTPKSWRGTQHRASPLLKKVWGDMSPSHSTYLCPWWWLCISFSELCL